MKKYNQNRDRRIIYPPSNYQKKFLCYLDWYASIDDIKKNEDLDKVYPKLSQKIRRLFKNGSIKILTITMLNGNSVIFDFSKVRIYCNSPEGCSQIISFLRHFRNSIAHGKIEYMSKKFIIIDENDKGETTANGEIDESTIKELFKIINIQ